MPEPYAFNFISQRPEIGDIIGNFSVWGPHGEIYYHFGLLYEVLSVFEADKNVFRCRSIHDKKLKTITYRKNQVQVFQDSIEYYLASREEYKLKNALNRPRYEKGISNSEIASRAKPWNELPSEIFKKWQGFDLMPVHGNSILVWKHVTKTAKHWAGNLNAPYKVGVRQQYKEAMCCAGPSGALNDYGNVNVPYVMAMWAHRIAVATNHTDGSFYVPDVTPCAVYRVTEKTMIFNENGKNDVEYGFKLVEGIDALELIGG